MSREKNIEVFKDTLKQCLNNSKLSNSIDNSIKNQYIVSKMKIRSPQRFDDAATIKITPYRTLEAASKYKNEKVCILNFASYTNPGGGVLKGSRAQEESLCRCSTLYIPLKRIDKYYYERHRNQLELNKISPVHGDECIYTPDITVFKSDTRIPKLLDEKYWYDVNVISSAAPNLRKNPSNIMNPNSGNKSIKLTDGELFKIQKRRIRQIFEIAKQEHIDVLILGAFGCGAFKNPPKIVAKAFKENVNKFRYDFKVIEFAIHRPEKGSINYDVFKETFDCML